MTLVKDLKFPKCTEQGTAVMEIRVSNQVIRVIGLIDTPDGNKLVALDANRERFEMEPNLHVDVVK